MPRRMALGYGIGAFGLTSFGTVPGLLLAIYLTDELGVAAGLASIVVLLPKAWDVFFMPYVGRLSDRLAARSGSRAPLLLFGALGLAIGFPLMFGVPRSFLGVAAALWVLVAFTLAASAFAMYVVPYTALSAEITSSTQQRTSLMSWRVAFQATGIITFGVGAPLIRSSATDGPWAGYALMALCVGVVAGIALLLCWSRLRRMPRRVVGLIAERESIREQMRTLSRIPSLRRLVLAFALQAVATGAILTGLAYYSSYVLGIASYAVVFGVLLLPIVLTMPIWNRWGRRHGNRAGFLLSSTVFLIGILASPLALVLPAWVMLAILAFAATGYGGMQLFPLALLPDEISASATESGIQRAGSFTGVWVAVETVCFAIGPAIFLLILALGGFVASSTGGAEQPASAIAAIVVGFGVGPALIVAASIPLIRRLPVPQTSGK